VRRAPAINSSTAAPAVAPTNWATQYITISLALIRPATKAARLTAGLT
jgi:hypothetical protein